MVRNGTDKILEEDNNNNIQNPTGSVYGLR
jgi:hypothetical protein